MGAIYIVNHCCVLVESLCDWYQGNRIRGEFRQIWLEESESFWGNAAIDTPLPFLYQTGRILLRL
jgi:hypothetical protein